MNDRGTAGVRESMRPKQDRVAVFVGLNNKIGTDPQIRAGEEEPVVSLARFLPDLWNSPHVRRLIARMILS